MAKQKTTKELEKLIPSHIVGHHGELTIIKRNQNKFICHYPFSIGNQTIENTKGKTINSALNKMYNQLQDKGYIEKEKVIVKKKKKKKVSNITKKKMSDKARRALKLKAQNRNLKNK